MMALVFVCRVGRKAGKRAVESLVKELLIFLFDEHTSPGSVTCNDINKVLFVTYKIFWYP